MGILKKNSEREAKLNDLREKRSSSVGYGFGSCTKRTVTLNTSIDQSHRAVSHGSLLRQSMTGSVGTDSGTTNAGSNANSAMGRAQRRAVSASCLNRRSVTAGSHGKYRGVIMVILPRGNIINSFLGSNSICLWQIVLLPRKESNGFNQKEAVDKSFMQKIK